MTMQMRNPRNLWTKLQPMRLRKNENRMNKRQLWKRFDIFISGKKSDSQENKEFNEEAEKKKFTRLKFLLEQTSLYSTFLSDKLQVDIACFSV
jgi:hypothetical protein